MNPITNLKDKRKACPTCGNDFACCGILRTDQHLFKKTTTFSVCSCIKCGTEWEFEIK